MKPAALDSLLRGLTSVVILVATSSVSATVLAQTVSRPRRSSGYTAATSVTREPAD